MDGSTSLSPEAPEEASSAQRRLRAMSRKASSALQRLIGRRPVEGFVDKVLAGEVRGWALDPNRPGRRVHVVARCEGRVVAEALADLPRRDLLADGRGDGRCAFALRLPAALLDGAPRILRVEAQTGPWRTRLVGGELRLGREEGGRAAGASLADSRQAADLQPHVSISEPPGAALLLWGEASDDVMAATVASWSAQDWSRTAIASLDPRGWGAVLAVGGGSAEDSLRILAEAHTVVLAKAGDRLDPGLARVLTQSRPLADVVTWDVDGGAGRRPWGRALGVLFGEALGGALAVRGHVLAEAIAQLKALGKNPDVRALELWLAAQAGLRWTHLPAALIDRGIDIGGWAPIGEALGRGLEGFDWLPEETDRPGRLAPRRKAARISLGLWPTAGDAVAALVSELASAAPGAELEVLIPSASAHGLQDRLHATAGEAAPLISVKPVDPPRGPGDGGWLRAMGQAASGEAVVLLHASVRPSFPASALEEIAAWTLSPLVGTVSIDIGIDDGRRLSGLELRAGADGWRAASAYDPAREGQRRPVLAAPQGFLSIARDKLAAMGGFDADRFPGRGSELDLALRLRTAGACSVLMGDLHASAPSSTELGAELCGATMAPFDPTALAAAQAAPR
jgi:hypothetical protein